MKRLSVIVQAIVLGCVSLEGAAAEVEYRHPNVTIIAENEPLNFVLKSLSEEMHVKVTSPEGVNPLVNCDIRDQPVTQAFRKLLGEQSYSLVWSENGERLTGIVILPQGGFSEADSKAARSAEFGDGATTNTNGATGITDDNLAVYGDNVQQDERQLHTRRDREEREVHSVDGREAHDHESEERMHEERIARQSRMREETQRQEAEARAFLESHGVQLLNTELFSNIPE